VSAERKRRDARPIGQLAEEFVARIDPHGRRHEGRVMAAWPSVAGEEVARHTLGFAMTDGELVVMVDSPTWANELSLMSEDYKRRLNEAVGEELVRAVRFSVSKRVDEARALEAEDRRTAGFYDETHAAHEDLTDEERARVQRLAEAIPEGAVRDAATSFMTQDLKHRDDVPAVPEDPSSEGSEVDPQTPPGER
jgi:hypothetical protein